MLDQASAATDKPGETLHPGVEPIFLQLGVLDDVLSAGFVRHDGYWIESRACRNFVPYSRDASSWFGFQAVRSRLEAILARAAVREGVELIRGTRARQPLAENGRVHGLACADQAFHSRFVIDCTGGTEWLRRTLGLPNHYASRKLIVRYGYSLQPVMGDGGYPVFRWEAHGWSWSAPLGEGRHALVCLDTRRSHNSDQKPDHDLALRGADVTWRFTPACAGPGYFMAGDAASVLDPASSHGVLKAMMTGILAADLAGKIVRGTISEAASIDHYRAWTAEWFWRDVAMLRRLYADAQLANEFQGTHPAAGIPSLQASL
jgi:flavin-dependent dehydrogenase